MYSDDTGEYSVSRLWELTEGLPIVEVETRTLRHNLHETVWDTNDNKRTTVNEVLRRLIYYPTHRERIHQADLAYPILLSVKGEILDGMHRLCRCILERRRIIKCRVVPYGILEQARISGEPCWRHSSI